jgi:hypothetical protein
VAFRQGRNQEGIGHRTDAAEDRGEDFLLVDGLGRSLADADVVEGGLGHVDRHVPDVLARQGQDCQVGLFLHLGGQVGRHGQEEVDTAGLQLKEGGRILGDFAEGQAFDLGRSGICGNRRAPGIIIVAHQHGFLADAKAFQLVGAGAVDFGHAVVVTQGR